jgi:hypothetical protein
MEHANFRTALSLLLRSMQAGQPTHEFSLEVGLTPPVLTALGLPELPMIISAKAIDKIFFQHGIHESRLQRLYDLIAAPKSIYRSDSPHIDRTKVNPVVVVTVEVKDADPILIAIHPEQEIGRLKEKVNVIKSVYDKPAAMLDKWRDKGLLLWEVVGSVAVPTAQVMPAAPVITMKPRRTITKN